VIAIQNLGDGMEFMTATTRRPGRIISRSGGSVLVEWPGDGSTRTIHAHDRNGDPVERTVLVGARRETISLGTQVERWMR